MSERAKCAAEHYTREEVSGLLCRMFWLGREDGVDNPGREYGVEAIADRLLAERAKP